jgi:hypothetical protein
MRSIGDTYRPERHDEQDDRPPVMANLAHRLEQVDDVEASPPGRRRVLRKCRCAQARAARRPAAPGHLSELPHLASFHYVSSEKCSEKAVAS